DPAAADRARRRYSCFDHFGEDAQAYGYSAAFNLDQSCEDEVVRQLAEVVRGAGGIEAHADPEWQFSAAQNAGLVKNAEAYYRGMFRGRVSSWNMRDQHMVETLVELDGHLRNAGRPADGATSTPHSAASAPRIVV